ncbi:MAG: RluA family pseudouridine synthase [Gammaproteobacteria bacterium]|nr:RluA family pseudouridine synthase [Gammaproteobacteria bacterium]
MSQTIRLSRQAGSKYAGQRIDQAATELFGGYSRARLQAWISDGSLTMDDRRVKPKQRLAGGEWLKLEADIEADGDAQAQPLELEVIAADDDIIVINKPPGLVVHPAAGHPDGTLLNGLLHFDRALASLPRAGIVHRLDKDTSGIMVVARNLKAHASLVAQLQKREVSRIYEALVCGQANVSGTVDAPIGRNSRDRKKMAVVSNGKPAVTHYRQLFVKAGVSHLELALESGRTHQIRVHMQHIGLPLLGDPQYGPPRGATRLWPDWLVAAVDRFGRQALHARQLRFTHPGSGSLCGFEAPLATDFADLLRSIRESSGS